ncbi:MAG: DNA translocase FtsK 4TM domain-containing protein [Eubacterium sp.]
MATTRKKKSAPRKNTAVRKSSKKKSRSSTMDPNLKRRIIGALLAVLGVYVAYAYSTATPGILDKIVGKWVFTYLFGNTTFMVALYIIAVGIMVFLDKHKVKSQTLIMVFLLLVNMMIIFSLNIPKLMGYKILDLFSLTWYNEFTDGGVIGIILSYLGQMLITKVGTIMLLIGATIVEILVIIRANFNDYYQRMKEQRFGLAPLKGKVDSLVEDRKLSKELKEATAEEERETSLKDEEYDGFFKRSETGQVSIDTEILDFIDDVNKELDTDDSLDDISDAESSLPPIPEDKKQQNKIVDELLDLSDHSIEDEGENPINPAEKAEAYHFPTVDLLNPPVLSSKNKKEDVVKKAKKIEETLASFGVCAKIVGVDVGPSITRFELQPDAGVKVNKIVSLSDDLALNLATSDIRIEAPIPGKSAVGIEVPNVESDIVAIREIIETSAFEKTKTTLPFALGKTLSGQNIIGDISKMPHMLIAGATGSGKSVCINAIIISLLYKMSPEDLKFIMIDPKMVELNQYNAIPHLLIPVVTDPKKASYALNWGIKEMTERYQLFKESGVREIDAYNERMVLEGGIKLPRIVIVVDELADLMMTSPKECENAICRIAQLARACGIHLIIATQRPSVDVITGLIKANIPSRIAFSVASNTDSRTILDMGGAEKLLGKGDMLYFPTGKSKPLRVQCTYVSDAEINRVINAVKPLKQPTYNDTIEEEIEDYQEQVKEDKDTDPFFDQAVEIAFTYNQVSTSMLQRKLKVGYARAGRLVDTLEQKGIISGPNGSKARTLLMTREEYGR